MSTPPPNYTKLSDQNSIQGEWDVWHSIALQDPAWDTFLRSTPMGQYQQSSLWAEFKAGEGWSHHRVVLSDETRIAGGFQMLWRRKGPLRIGYVSKGPVAHPDSAEIQLELNRHLINSAHELRLSALIIQRPDEMAGSEGGAEEPSCFIRSNPMKVIEATYLLNVSEGMEVVRRRMHRNVRQCVRKAREQGVTVRAGTEADLPVFFNLMSATCRRQGSTPNPGSLGSLRRLWHLFNRSGSVELAFAGRDGHDIAGRMNLIFGDRVTQWKKGWDGTHPEWHPNELLADHALEWAHAHSHHLCDFSAMSRRTAEHLLAGRPSDAAIARTRDMFNLRLGGYPQLLPCAQIFLPNPILRWTYRHIYRRMERRKEQQLHSR